jgi:small-conductance mechanosensitive channel
MKQKMDPIKPRTRISWILQVIIGYLGQILLYLLILFLSACSTQAPTPISLDPVTNLVQAITPSPQHQATGESESDNSGSTAEDMASTVASRTPVPTPTPSVADQEINQLTASLGLAGKTFLGLSADDWINLAISIVIVVAGYFLGFRLLVWLLKWYARRTSRDYDESILKELSPDLKLLLLVFFTRFAVLRLDFLSDGFRTIADDVFFIMVLVLVSIIAIKLINFSLNHYITSKDREYDPEKLDPLVTTIQRVSDFAVLIIVGSIGASHFGIGASALAVALIIFSLILYLGARGIIADFMAGFIILIDQPFRVNDAVFIKDLDRWGVVLDIGTRTTRIRTEDNREVIIPNSKINQSEVINYSYPDPRYRLVTEIGVAYGSDPDKMRQVIEETVRGVVGVLPDQPVDALFLAFGATSRKVRVRYWIDSYENEHSIQDKVNNALEVALRESGIELPFDTYNLNVSLEGDKFNQTI